MSWEASVTVLMGFLVTVLGYLVGYKIGYRNARRTYLPSLVESEREHARLIDQLSRMTGRKSDAVERERKWEDKLRDMGLEVPDEQELQVGSGRDI